MTRFTTLPGDPRFSVFQMLVDYFFILQCQYVEGICVNLPRKGSHPEVNDDVRYFIIPPTDQSTWHNFSLLFFLININWRNLS